MQITYDAEADAAYIQVAKGKVQKTLKITDAVLVNVDKRGQALGVELLVVSTFV